MIDDTVQIRCHRCKGTFREKARRLQSGFSRQCITCETMLFFDEDSNDKNVRRTLREARQIRKALREAEAYDGVKKAAIEFHIPILNQNRFLYFVGYYEMAQR